MNKILKILRFIMNHPLGRKNKLFSFLRFFYWQISSKLHLKKKDFVFINNLKLNLNPHQTVSTGNYYVGLLEFHEMSFVAHFLRKDDTFFDIGANIGTYSLIASGVASAKSISFEPIPKTFEYFIKNIALNKLESQITALQLGVAEKSGYADFTIALDAGNHIVIEEEKEKTISVEIKTLSEFKQHKPTMIKIDVEGYEEFILSGAGDLLDLPELKVIITEINNERKRYHLSGDSLNLLLTNKGFCLFQYDPFSRNLTPLNSSSSDNRLYIRDLDFVSRRVQTGKKFKVRNQYI